MRYVFASWALPLGIFWAWYFLSLNDISFGYTMLTRDVHDLVFRIYGDVLGMDPQAIPALAARACVIDTTLILAIWAFRRRRQIRAWFSQKYAGLKEPVTAAGPILSPYAVSEAGQLPPAE